MTNPYQPQSVSAESSESGLVTEQDAADQERSRSGEWIGWLLLSLASFITGGVASNFEFRNLVAFIMFLCGILAAIMALLAQTQQTKQSQR